MSQPLQEVVEAVTREGQWDVEPQDSPRPEGGGAWREIMDQSKICFSAIIGCLALNWRNNTVRNKAFLPKKLGIIVVSELAFILTGVVAVVECVVRALLACLLSPFLLCKNKKGCLGWVFAVSYACAKGARDSLFTARYAASYILSNVLLNKELPNQFVRRIINGSDTESSQGSRLNDLSSQSLSPKDDHPISP